MERIRRATVTPTTSVVPTTTGQNSAWTSMIRRCTRIVCRAAVRPLLVTLINSNLSEAVRRYPAVKAGKPAAPQQYEKCSGTVDLTGSVTAHPCSPAVAVTSHV